MPDFEERTEQATPRRREKAREKGSIPRSRELVSMVTSGGAIVVFYFAGKTFMDGSLDLVRDLLGFRYGKDPLTVMKLAFPKLVLILTPFWVATSLFALFAGTVQGGILLRPLGFDFERLNPLSGLKRVFSISALFEFLKTLLRFLIGGVLSYYVIKRAIPHVSITPTMDLKTIEEISLRFVWKAVFWMFSVFLVLAVVDYLIERWRFERSIRMTRQELKEEMKESEGDPLIKSRVRSLQRELARKRMMQEVPKATVVITNPTHLAVALMYRREETSAPKVIAKGAGFVAERIKEIAREHGIPISEDKPLARALYKLEIGSFIPEELYRAVARILAHIYRLRGDL